MTETPYDGTINWDKYWQEAADPIDDDANGSMELIVNPLFEFIDEKGVPDSYADVGCGGGELAFTVAKRHSDTTVVGYDAAAPVVAQNRCRANGQDYPAVQFDRAVLPEFSPDQEFELVTAFFTLCYVPEVEASLQALYDAVAPGGHLVITYHNRYAQSLFATYAQDPHEHFGSDSVFDPDTFADRFELVIDGESLLSYTRIQERLNTWPQSVWSVIEAEPYGARKQNPLVFVPN
jgi:Methylase involved in ubiquinone/menaquinone biosynthesis